jgi:hypothetical protein
MHVTVAGSFVVPKKLYQEVCRHFAGEIRKDPGIERYFENTGKRPRQSELDAFKLGQVHFRLRGGRSLDVPFYEVGKGGIGL